MWSEKRELFKHAAKLAGEKHPEGFNKKQLIDASKEVFGGYSSDPSKPIRTMDDVNNMGNHMAYIDGHYPVGMSGCYVVGINGGCGATCPVFQKGGCGEPQEFSFDYLVSELGEDQAKDVAEMYSCFDFDTQ